MKTDATLLQYIANWDNASTDLLVQLRALGFEGAADNIKICRQAEAKLAEQDSLLKTYKECSDKQLQWIRNAKDAIHPECDVTSNPESLRGKTLRLSQTAEIERLKEINNNLIEANERLSARVADWDEVCKALWARGYCQLPQRVNETPLGSCLRLIAEGSPDPANAQASKPRTDQSNPLFSHSAVHCVDGQVGKFSGGYTVRVDMGVRELGKRATTILEKVPLTSADLPLGTVIRLAYDPGSESMITCRNEKYVWLGSATTGVDGTYLMHEGGEYRLPGTEDWKPCHKHVNRTPES